MSTRSSPVQITTYKRPQGFAALVFGGAVLSFISLAGVVFIPDDSWVWQILDDISSGRAESFRWITKTAVPPLIAIHTIEAIAFDRTRLTRHGIPRWGLLWWKWVLTCWIEGFTCWQRFASVITTKSAKR